MIPAFMADWANKKRKKEEDDMIMNKRRFISPEDRPDNQHVYNPPQGPVNKEGNPREIQTKGGGAPRVPTPMEEAEAANWLAPSFPLSCSSLSNSSNSFSISSRVPNLGGSIGCSPSGIGASGA